MDMTKNEKKAVNFLKKHLWSHKSVPLPEIDYRFSHSLRTAAIGRVIAQKEGLNEEALALGCILHDLGKFDTHQNSEHGRVSARLARPFLQKLALEPMLIDEICFGIAIHVDQVADFEGEYTVLADSIQDCDRIEHMGMYRAYNYLSSCQLQTLPVEDQITRVSSLIEKTERVRTRVRFATPTAFEMWHENQQLQKLFFSQLKIQLESGVLV